MEERRGRPGLLQDIARGAEGFRPSVPDEQGGRGEAQGLFHGVGDMENRDVPCVRDAGDVLHEFGAPGRIKRRPEARP